MPGVSTEAVLATGERSRSDMDKNPDRPITVNTMSPDFAGARAQYTGGTDWLRPGDRVVAPPAESVLKKAWCRYPRTKLSLLEVTGEAELPA